MHFRPIDNIGDEGYLSRASGSPPSIHRQSSNHAFDDVFGDDDDDGNDEVFAEHRTSHPSDMRRLESEHTTAGYREGLTVGKQQWLQAGFDEGYGMGAAVGLRAGQLLGLLEGIGEALGGEDARFDQLLKEAKVELSVEKMLSGDYWTEEGLWKYEVERELGRQARNSDGGEKHPLVRKWTVLVGDELARYHINQGIFENAGAKALVPAATDEPKVVGELPKKDLLDW